MKLLFAIVQNEDTKPLIRELVEHDISVTRISSSGGFLRSGNNTLMIGVEKSRLQETLDIIKDKSSARKSITASTAGSYIESMPMSLEITVGGATVFIMDVDQFVKY
jgi:uncharacterized protein YaaQ